VGFTIVAILEKGVDFDGSFACVVLAGRNSDYFSVEINYGGYFLGQGNNRCYVNGIFVFFDHVDSRTWSPAILEDLVEDLCYEMKGRKGDSVLSHANTRNCKELPETFGGPN
jgi:hypothetical protein